MVNKKSFATTLAEQAVLKQNELDIKNVGAMSGTEAGSIWHDISNKPIDMFSIPDQKVFMHCHPVMIEPTKLYLLTNSPAVLPSLEKTLGDQFIITLTDKFLVVSRA
jgi:hypothetical protein